MCITAHHNAVTHIYIYACTHTHTHTHTHTCSHMDLYIYRSMHIHTHTHTLSLSHSLSLSFLSTYVCSKLLLKLNVQTADGINENFTTYFMSVGLPVFHFLPFDSSRNFGSSRWCWDFLGHYKGYTVTKCQTLHDGRAFSLRSELQIICTTSHAGFVELGWLEAVWLFSLSSPPPSPDHSICQTVETQRSWSFIEFGIDWV